MHEITVIAPVYNEEQNISEFITRVDSNLKIISDNYKIILVDDGSKDASWIKIETECLKNKNVAGLKLSKNFGHHFAITAGIHNSNSEWVVVMDSDLQDRPEVIPMLFKKAKDGFDVVFVSRIDRPEAKWYLLIQKLFYFALRILSGIDFDSRQANYSIISNKVVESFKQFPENARFYPTTLKWLGFNRSEIQAKHGIRHSGRASYTLGKRIKLASDVILAFSERPLKFAIGLGCIFSILSFLFTLYLMIKKVTLGFTITGWTSIMVSLFFFSGLILTVLGINGIYLSKVFTEVKRRPLFIVEKSFGL
jgi:glycosyltransferase involved in cell wall biosynthesis